MKGRRCALAFLFGSRLFCFPLFEANSGPSFFTAMPNARQPALFDIYNRFFGKCLVFFSFSVCQLFHQNCFSRCLDQNFFYIFLKKKEWCHSAVKVRGKGMISRSLDGLKRKWEKKVTPLFLCAFFLLFTFCNSVFLKIIYWINIENNLPLDCHDIIVQFLFGGVLRASL